MQSFFRIVRPAGQLSLTNLRVSRPVGSATWQTSLGLKSIASRSAQFQSQTHTQARAFQSTPRCNDDSKDQQTVKNDELAPDPADAPENNGVASLEVVEEAMFLDQVATVDGPDLLDAPEDHGIAHLDKPWRPSDLRFIDRLAYVKYGPNFLEHLSPEEKEFSMKSLAVLKTRAHGLEERLGPDWYAIVCEAKNLRAENLRAEGRSSGQWMYVHFDTLERRAAFLAEGATLTGTTPKDEEFRKFEEKHRSILAQRKTFWRTGPGSLDRCIAKVVRDAKVEADLTKLRSKRARMRKRIKEKRRLKKKEGLASEGATDPAQTTDALTDAPEIPQAAASQTSKTEKNGKKATDQTTSAPTDALENPPVAIDASMVEDAAKGA